MCSFAPPRTISVCKSAAPGDARDKTASDQKKIIMKLRVNWGHAAAQQTKRVAVDSEI